MIFFGGRKKVDTKKFGPQRGVKLQPLDTIDGFKVRPGYYNRDVVHCCCSGRGKRSLMRG